MKLLMFLLLFSSTWHRLYEYPDILYAARGDLIQSSLDPPISQHIEIAYSPSNNSYGLSFFNSDEEQKFVLNGVFNIRYCGLASAGRLFGPKMFFYDQPKIISCSSAIFVRISDNDGYSLYKIVRNQDDKRIY